MTSFPQVEPDPGTPSLFQFSQLLNSNCQHFCELPLFNRDFYHSVRTTFFLFSQMKNNWDSEMRWLRWSRMSKCQRRNSNTGLLNQASLHYLSALVLVTQSCLLCVTLWTVVRLAPLSMEFPRQEYCSWVAMHSSGDLPDPGIEPASHVSCIGRQTLFH